ncbi:Glycosyltransferase Family 24 protein [Gigaspora rosea]|uniref:Glycosyltransferase Family 24 protein n=1 Tax=Gigaspora rosea TaxID=44941 RepID=A0A397UPU3_9GLOM|nr:Glycosyltransferase Family 24 protein [Gigaspora rosea]
MILRKFISILVICFLSLIFISNAETPPVQAWIKTSWEAPYLVLEIIESVAVENSSAYFSLIDEFLGRGLISSNTMSDRDLYKQALDIIESGQYLSVPTSLSFLEFALYLHTTAPAVQAYYHYYNATVVPSTKDYIENHENLKFDPECDVWVDWYGNQACSIEEFKRITGITDNNKFDLSFNIKSDAPFPKLLPFDHILQYDEVTPIAILYANLYSPDFVTFHKLLSDLAKNGVLNYVLRYRPPREKRDMLYLSGYGVELALKNTDYIVLDDRDDVNVNENDNQEPIFQERSSTDHLFDQQISEIKPLKFGEITDLGLKAAQFVLEAQNPLLALSQLSQDFPKYSGPISQITLNSTWEAEIQLNQQYITDLEKNSIWINGLNLDSHTVDPFSLLKTLRRERQIMLSLKSLGLNLQRAVELLASPIISESKSSQDLFRGVFDVRDKSDEKHVIVWLNDLEKENRYAHWPHRIYELLRPVYPGQMRYIRRNLFSVLFVLDLSYVDNLKTITDYVNTLIARDIPIRFGVVPLFSDDQPNALVMAQIFYYLVDRYSTTLTMDFLTQIYSELNKKSTKEFIEIIREKYNHVINDKKLNEEKSSSTFEDIINSENSPVRKQIEDAAEFIKRFHIKPDDDGVLFVNGKYFDMDENYQRNMIQMINEYTMFLQQKVYIGEINDVTDIYDYFMSMPGIPDRRNSYIFVSDDKPLNVVNLVIDNNWSNVPINNLKYIYSENQTSEEIPMTILIVSDFNQEYGAMQALKALEFLDSSPNVRISFIHNPSNDTGDSIMSSMIYYLLYEVADLPKDLSFKSAFKEFLDKLSLEKNHMKDGDDEHQIPIGKIVNSAVSAGWQMIDNLKADKYWKDMKPFIKNRLKLDKGDTAFVVNGRIVGPIDPKDSFTPDDFELLANTELNERINPVIEAVKNLNLNLTLQGTNYSDFFFKLTSVISVSGVSDGPVSLFNVQNNKRDLLYQSLKRNYGLIQIGQKETAMYYISAVVDPLSQTAQKWSTILMALSQIEGVYIELYLYPQLNLKELPIKRFYRYVLEPRLTFNATTGALIPPTAYFAHLPEDPLLTLGMDVIQSWLVTPKASIHDLDNIRLANLTKGVDALFELKNILIEGHAFDVTTNSPPSGLQLILGTNNYPAMVDTIVMANLGYFQLKANPGVWTLQLREGKSKEIYDILSVGSEGWFSRNVNETGYEIVLNSFEGPIIYPRFVRKPGKENVNIKDDENDDSFWDYITNKFSHKQDIHKQDKAEINIFSVASGHLYERFLYIMILSVLRHTNSKVKFWFIENFLSPSFKDFIPHMAKEHGFEYELVTYKWPHWLRNQAEKQRTIWGYKILFLDVLFPLDLDKVIFVDADQIVRADLKELVDMDLNGAPYGYTPFCDNRPDMDGFRFWKSGYWSEHLNGKPYHISALYVIDLQRFRHVAAGDKIRGQYQYLSADPNSLSNLDQDLPNNMQHIVPIFSLPQEWLWCETWCSNESLSTAKTIDLCNNPLTKEPKLDRAKRQIPEWESYDNEVAALAEKITQQKASAPDNKQNVPERILHDHDEL